MKIVQFTLVFVLCSSVFAGESSPGQVQAAVDKFNEKQEWRLTQLGVEDPRFHRKTGTLFPLLQNYLRENSDALLRASALDRTFNPYELARRKILESRGERVPSLEEALVVVKLNCPEFAEESKETGELRIHWRNGTYTSQAEDDSVKSFVKDVEKTFAVFERMYPDYAMGTERYKLLDLLLRTNETFKELRVLDYPRALALGREHIESRLKK